MKCVAHLLFKRFEGMLHRPFSVRIISDALLSRFCIFSNTASCSHRRTRRWVLGVRFDFSTHPWKLELQ
jgi:hypothetical protein